MAFVNLQRLLDLNADQGEQMAQTALNTSGANAALNGAAAGIVRGDKDAEGKVAQAEGMGRTMGAYGGQMNALDSALAGQSNAMQQYQQRTNNLRKMMGDYQGAAERRQVADQRWQQNIADADRVYAAQQQQQQARYAQATRGYRRVDMPPNHAGAWNGSYNPQTAAEYAAYSDAIQKGYR